jgi:hypothetical protein
LGAVSDLLRDDLYGRPENCACQSRDISGIQIRCLEAARLAWGLAAIVMPDHLHIVAALIKNREAKLGNFSAALKRWMREQLGASWQWHAGCFDRLLRTNESLPDEWLYVRKNPVRAGLVQKWEDRPYRSEFNEEMGKRRACPTRLYRIASVPGIRSPQ